jgi:hypothetical protein
MRQELQELQKLQLVKAVRVCGQAVCLLGDILSLLTAYLLRLQVVYSSRRSIQVYDALYTSSLASDKRNPTSCFGIREEFCPSHVKACGVYILNIA